jgi:hypothetical protein
VPTECLDDVAGKLQKSGKWEPFRPSAMTTVMEIDQSFPRFKRIVMACFLVVLSSQNCHIPCSFENIEQGQTGLPFPKLAVCVQSFLNTHNEVDLDDLVDGMNLTEEWGRENLKLDGVTDVEWAKWKNQKLKQINGEHCFKWTERPINVRGTWERAVSADREKKAQGWKFSQHPETRFWRRGQRDPRRRPGGY